MTPVRLPWRRVPAHPSGPAVPPTVVVADDVEAIRILVRTTLEPDFTIVAEAADGLAAVRSCDEHQPDLCLLDLNMPRQDGLQAIRRIRDASPRTRIVVLSGMPPAAVSQQAIDLGACAFVDKAAPLEELRAALLAALPR